MALMTCYECDGKVSSLARACPHCGAPMQNKLMHVVESGDFSSLQQLVDRGSDVNAGDKMGATALMKAAEKGRIEMVELLLSKGADFKVGD